MSTPLDPALRRARIRATIEITLGVALTAAGVVVSYLTYSAAGAGGTYYVWRGGIAAGVITILHGIWRMMAAYDRPDDRPSFDLGDLPAVSSTSTLGYKSFVAWRYLLERRRRVRRWVQLAIVGGLLLRLAFWLIFGDGVGEERLDTWYGIVEIATWLFVGVVMFWGVLRYSKPAMFIFLLGTAVGIGCGVASYMVRARATGVFELEDARPLLQSLGIGALAGWGVAGLAMFFGSLRAFFTFFTTVPIGGVWIGTAALVLVLS
ncbi:MAG: hypothetical protein H0T79_20800, partial [Deltaproteobacteria bacterium]|nr:hypothetical protein [Deltaproteobacteria bacterium]